MNPLNKNKVIEFIKRHPTSSDFVLIETNQDLAAKPGENKPTSISLPKCGVGITGAGGNPADFNVLIDMWLAGGLTRANINPFGLMRLWAATYRTYYDWVKKVKRPYFNPNGSTITSTTRLLQPEDYSIEYTSSYGSGSISNKVLGGGMTEGYHDSTAASSSDNSWRGNGISLGPSSINSASKAFRVKEYFPSALVNNFTQNISGGSYSAPIGGPFGGIDLIYGGPIVSTLKFRDAVDIKSIRIPPIIQKGLIANPESSNIPYQWFLPSNYKFKISYDGAAYSDGIDYGDILNNFTADIPISSGGPLADSQSLYNANAARFLLDRRQIAYEGGSSNINSFRDNGNQFQSFNSRAYTYNAISWQALYNDLNTYTDSYYYSILEANRTQASSFVNWSLIPRLLNNNYLSSSTVNASPFKGIITSVETSDYEIQVGTSVNGNQIDTIVLKHTPTGTFRTCQIRSYLTVVDSPRNTALNPFSSQALPLDYVRNSLFTLEYGRFEVYFSGAVVAQGDIKPTFMPLAGVKALEITSGFNDGTTLRPYLVGFIYVEGIIKSISSIPLSNVNNYIPNFADAYWSANSPEVFDIGGVSFSDKIFETAIKLPNSRNFDTGEIGLITNIDKWKLLPFSLPYSSSSLQGQINNSPSTVRNVPLDFDYSEDYLNNKLIKFPKLSEIPTLNQRGLDTNTSASEVYFRAAFSDFLKELIEHCKTTCLRFWRGGGPGTSVYDYKSYTDRVLQFDNVTDPVRGNGAGIVVYEIPTGGVFDIESNVGATNLWFLSGGGPSRIEIDLAVLQKLLDVAGITI